MIEHNVAGFNTEIRTRDLQIRTKQECGPFDLDVTWRYVDEEVFVNIGSSCRYIELYVPAVFPLLVTGEEANRLDRILWCGDKYISCHACLWVWRLHPECEVTSVIMNTYWMEFSAVEFFNLGFFAYSSGSQPFWLAEPFLESISMAEPLSPTLCLTS